jgi:hypothetical protein
MKTIDLLLEKESWMNIAYVKLKILDCWLLNWGLRYQKAPQSKYLDRRITMELRN